jgi:hypothetical protein
MTDNPADTNDSVAGPTVPIESITPNQPTSVYAAIAGRERFQVAAMGPGAFLDAGLPLVVFTIAYALTGRDLAMALYIALGSGIVLAAVRLIRGDQFQNVVAGFLGLAVAAIWAGWTGKPEDVFLPGLLINIGYGLAFLVSILVRWPLVGLFAGLVTTPGDLRQAVSWRTDPVLVRAYSKATALFIVMFGARLAVQLPLYLAGSEQLGWLATARLVMGVPLFLLVAYCAWLIIRPAHQAHVGAGSASDD